MSPPTGIFFALAGVFLPWSVSPPAGIFIALVGVPTDRDPSHHYLFFALAGVSTNRDCKGINR